MEKAARKTDGNVFFAVAFNYGEWEEKERACYAIRLALINPMSTTQESFPVDDPSKAWNKQSITDLRTSRQSRSKLSSVIMALNWWQRSNTDLKHEYTSWIVLRVEPRQKQLYSEQIHVTSYTAESKSLRYSTKQHTVYCFSNHLATPTSNCCSLRSFCSEQNDLYTLTRGLPRRIDALRGAPARTRGSTYPQWSAKIPVTLQASLSDQTTITCTKSSLLISRSLAKAWNSFVQFESKQSPSFAFESNQIPYSTENF